MSFSIDSFLSLYRFPTGRRLFCLRRMRASLTADSLRDLHDEVTAAIAADRATLDLEDAYRLRGSRGEHAPEARALGGELERALGALDDGLAALVKGFGPESERGEAAQEAREQLFPGGLGHTTNLPFVEQEVAVKGLLRRVDATAALRQTLRELGAEQYVARVAEVNRRFGQALHAAPEGPTYDDLVAARRAGQERLHWIVVDAAARLRKRAPGSAERVALERALERVLEQHEAIKRYRRRRRGVVADVDPETGHEVPEAEASPPALPLREPPSGAFEAA